MIVLLYLTAGLAVLSQFRDLLPLVGPARLLLSLAPEVVSGLILIAISLELARSKRFALHPKYVIVGLILLAHVVFGLIANAVSPGAVIGGIRAYFAFIPLFVLPSVYEFSEKQIRTFAIFALGVALLQLPVSLYQRVFIFPTTPTGDVVRGTFPSGAIMSTFQVAVTVFLIALFIRKRLSLWLLGLTASLLLFPTLINETKGTVILLPVAALAIGIYSEASKGRLKTILSMSSIAVAFVFAFFVAYEHYFPDREPLTDFFTDDFVGNIYKQRETRPADTGRLDSVVFAYQELSKDLPSLFLGLGMGNVSHPDAMEVVRGEYGDFFYRYGAGVTTYATLLWNVGVIGIVLTLLILYMLFQDARRLSTNQSLVGTIGLGMVGVLAMIPIALFYKNYLFSNIIGVFAMFFAGYVASAANLKVHAQDLRRLMTEAGKARFSDGKLSAQTGTPS